MGYNRNTCIQCGRVYYPKSNNPKNKFCSDACSQKAYRSRRKVQRESEQHMITTEAYLIQQEIFDKHPDAKDHILGFYATHGKNAYVDLLYIFSLFMPTQKEVK